MAKIFRTMICVSLVMGVGLVGCSRSEEEPGPATEIVVEPPLSVEPEPTADMSMTPDSLGVDIGASALRSFEVEMEEGKPPVVIEVHREGEGAECPPEGVARIAFVARFADETVWDSSERRRFTLGVPLSEYGTIAGLRGAIVGMRAGEVRRAQIPWQLAYGEQGRPPIPARADLIFDIRLVSFEIPDPE